MKQVNHSNATTNVRLRSEINNSTAPNPSLSLKHNGSEKTIIKWRNRTTFKDISSRQHTIKYALSELQILIAVKLRVITW